MFYSVTITFVIGLTFIRGTVSASNATFTCTNGIEIPSEWVCDGSVECQDGKDEKHCACDGNKFSCEDGTGCLHFMQVCDGQEDCTDASDEKDSSCPMTSREVGTCPQSEFECLDGSRCLPPNFECNGKPECDDQSDEGVHCQNAKIDVDPVSTAMTITRNSIPKNCKRQPNRPTCIKYAAALAKFLKPKFVCKCRKKPAKAKCVKKKILVDMRGDVVCNAAPKRKKKARKSRKSKKCLKNPNRKGCKKLN